MRELTLMLLLPMLDRTAWLRLCEDNERLQMWAVIADQRWEKLMTLGD